MSSDTKNKLIFYPKKHRKGNFWTVLNYFLLSMGASSVVDIEEVTVENGKLIISYFLGKDIEIDMKDAYVKYDDNGKPFAVMGELDWLNLEKMAKPEEIAELVESHKSNNRINN